MKLTPTLGISMTCFARLHLLELHHKLTLIDNIFINDMTCHSFGGNLTSSISDHFLQFTGLSQVLESPGKSWILKSVLESP